MTEPTVDSTPHGGGLPPWVLAASGAVLWTALAVLVWHLRGSINFADRDDGVITLAHARNFVDHGSISVGRFGDRVFGFSAPLHFLLGIPYFALGGESFGTFSRVLDFSTFAAIGALSGLIVANELAAATTKVRSLALLATAALQLGSWSFFGWHFSGMENALTSLLLVAVVYLIPKVRTSGRAALGAGVLIALLAISRLDTVSLAAPLLLVALWEVRECRGRELLARGAALVAPPAAVGLVFAAAVRWYFGSLTSTTAANRPQTTNQLVGVGASTLALGVAAVALLAAVKRFAAPEATAGDRRSSALQGAASLGVLAYGVVSIAALAGTTTVRFGPTTLSIVGGWWTAALLLVAWAVPAVRPQRLLAFTVVLLWAPLYQFEFGPTRITLGRVVSSAVPVLAVAAVVVVGRLVGQVHLRSGRQLRPVDLRRARLGVIAGAVVLPLSLLYDATGAASNGYASTFYLGWVIDPRPQVLLSTAADTLRPLDPAPTPIVLAVDLGKLSYRAEAQIVDVGLIGDPLFLHIRKDHANEDRAQLMRSYLVDVMPPDTMMLNSTYACPVLALLEDDDEFRSRYRRVDVGAASYPEDGDLSRPIPCPDGDRQGGVWTLDDPEDRPDLVLASDLLAGRAELDDSFFDACRDGAVDECFAEVRAFRRAYPGADHAERGRQLLREADDNPVGRLAIALVTSPVDAGWSDAAHKALVQYVAATS